MTDVKQRVLRAVDDLAGELVDFTAELVRLPTVNPPGEAYEAFIARNAALQRRQGRLVKRGRIVKRGIRRRR